MNITEAALNAAVLKVLLDEVQARLATVKQDTMTAMTEAGESQSVPTLPDGTKIATVTLAAAGRHTAYVNNESELLAWVLAEHPEQVELVIRPTYQRALLDAAKEAGKAIDPVTGEVVPGITVKGSHGYVSVRFKTGGQDAVKAAWRAGELTQIELIAPDRTAVEAPNGQAPAGSGEPPGGGGSVNGT